MKKYIITGYSGFVSHHFLNLLEFNNEESKVLGLDINLPDFDTSQYRCVNCSFKKINLLDKKEVANILNKFRPNYILHLASFSSVAYSWKNPADTFVNNTNIFLNIVEQVRLLNIPCRILSVGSSEVYGVVNSGNIPITEENILNPVNPYAVARVSQEILSKIYVDNYGLDIVTTRSFNHIGPGQKDSFVISSFAKQIVQKKRLKEKCLEVGNINIVRDFLDVRDVVKAYINLLQYGKSGEIYNICSCQGYSLKEILEKMMQIAQVNFDYQINPIFFRPADIPIIIGSNKKIQHICGWQPKIKIEDSLRDIVNYWEMKS